MSAFGAFTGMTGALMKGSAGLRGESGASNALSDYYGRAMGQIDPYAQLGTEQATGLQNWLASPQGAWSQPTMEQIQQTPGYETRLGAIENSAAARGGLMSGNALRDIGEFGASEYDREMQRRQMELQNRLGVIQGMMPGSFGMSNLQTGLGQEMAGVQRNKAGSRGTMTDEFMGSMGSMGGMM